MPSGRRYSVVIFSLSPVKELYISALDHYDPDEMFIFRPNGDDPISQSSREIFDSIPADAICSTKQEIDIDSTDFKGILGRIIDVKRHLQEKYGDCLDLYINISSGTHEFAAAATFASMLPKNCTAFRVELDADAFDKDEIIEFVNGREFDVEPPESITTVQNRDPDEDIIGYLMVIKDLRRQTRYPKARQIIDALKEQGQWTHCPDRKSGSGRTPLWKKEEMYLKRHYETPALENGWLERTSRDELVLSDKGDVMISVYGVNDVLFCKSCSPNYTDVCYDMDASEEPAPFEFDEYSRSNVHDVMRMCDVSFDENVISVDSGEKTYRFRLSME